MSTSALAKTFIAESEIYPNSVVTFGTGPGTVVQASSSTETLFGVAALPAGTAVYEGDRVDVYIGGIVEIKAGAAITKGSYLTAAAEGQVVAASDSDRIIGVALENAAGGDIIPVLLAIA